MPGTRQGGSALAQAVADGLADAPRLLFAALHLRARRPYQRVEVELRPGAETQGEALPLAAGSIRLSLGEDAPPAEVRKIACHEALHLLLASALSGGQRWNDPEVAFADWIVRGVECGLDPRLPRLRAPFPGLLERLPASRTEVERQLETLTSAPAAARRYFGDALFPLLLEAKGQGRLWLVEAVLGVHHIEAAARLRGEDAGGLRAVILDDWLLDYEQYARALGNAPAEAGNLWRLSEPGWSADPLTRLSVAAQALQAFDLSFFSGDPFGPDGEPWVWKNRGTIRLPMLAQPPRARPRPIHGFRATLAGLDPALVEDAARGDAEGFEARVLWPRILARLLAGGARPPELAPPPPPVVQILDSGGPGAAETFQQWRAAADALRGVLGDCAPWVPSIAEPRKYLPDGGAALLVHDAAPSEHSVLQSRLLAAQAPIRWSAFRGDLGGGRAWERLPDTDPPVDPRYRDEVWLLGALPESLAQLPALIDAATQEGRLSTPLSHLLSMMAFGMEECHYP